MMAARKTPNISHELQTQLGSTHSRNLPTLLASGGVSLMLTTYQAKQLITIRHDGQGLNTHFCPFPKPMGLAVEQGRLALGCDRTIHEFYNMPAVGHRLKDLPRQPDACYLPRHSHITGNIDIHEMAWSREVLWFVNTRFSCLCTLQSGYSFNPRWRPPFISDLAPEDRCHLNGLEIVDGRPKYVTALGETNTPRGWHPNKARGGVLIDVQSNETIARGLSMPHSPRWYRNRLWVLESGNGSLAAVNPHTGELTTVTQLPGFTRGLAFGGHLAFVGLSQIRESAMSSGLPITARLSERLCGVWVVDINTGNVVARLTFQGNVKEIFAVALLAQTEFPEVLLHNHELLSTAYALSESALADVAP